MRQMNYTVTFPRVPRVNYKDDRLITALTSVSRKKRRARLSLIVSSEEEQRNRAKR